MTRILSVLLAGLILSACTDRDQQATDTPSTPYLFTVGAPIEDPGIATLVISNERIDTLRSDQFDTNLTRLNSMFPDVMSDPVQEQSIRREIVKQYVVEQLLKAEADRRGIDVDSEAVAARYDAYRSSFANDEEFKDELSRFGQSEADLADQLRMEVVRDSISKIVQSQTPHPTAAEIEAFRASLAERILAQHILFMVDEAMTRKEKDDLRNEAEAVLDSAKSGVNFGDLARRHSDDVGTAQVGGELPWFRRGDMVEAFENAAFDLKSPGDITDDLVTTTYGYHIIRLVDRDRDTPIAPNSAEAVLWRQRVRTAEREFIEGLQKDAEVRVNPDFVPGF